MAALIFSLNGRYSLKDVVKTKRDLQFRILIKINGKLIKS